MGNYIEPMDIWKELGKDAFTKSRGETLTTSGTNIWSTAKDNLISGSVVLYDGGTQVTSSAYAVDLDDGYITYTASSTVTADYNYSAIADSKVQDIIGMAEAQMERETGRTFNLVTSSTEYHDFTDAQEDIFLNNFPVQAVNTVEANTGDNTNPQWTSLVEGIGNDYYFVNDDLTDGRIKLIQNLPSKGRDRFRVNYDYGYSSGTLPSEVKQLAVLYSLNELVNSSVWKATYAGLKDFNPPSLASIDNQIRSLKNLLISESISGV